MPPRTFEPSLVFAILEDYYQQSLAQSVILTKYNIEVGVLSRIIIKFSEEYLRRHNSNRCEDVILPENLDTVWCDSKNRGKNKFIADGNICGDV